MPRVDEEHEESTGWRFTVEAGRPDPQTGEFRKLTVRLSWADYDHWSHGQEAPASVVRRMVGFLERSGVLADVRDDFDAGRVRRRVPGLDDFMLGSGSSDEFLL